MTTQEWIRMRPGCKIRGTSKKVYEVIKNLIITKDGDPYTIIGNRLWTFDGLELPLFECSAFQFSIVVEPEQGW